MNKRISVLIPSIFVALFAGQSHGTTDEEALRKDLTAVIALQGLPCGQVIAVKTQNENDFTASCKDGNKYRVYLSAAGRVMVENQK